MLLPVFQGPDEEAPKQPEPKPKTEDQVSTEVQPRGQSVLEKEVHDIVFRGRASRMQAIDVAELKRLTVEKAPSQSNL